MPSGFARDTLDAVSETLNAAGVCTEFASEISNAGSETLNAAGVRAELASEASNAAGVRTEFACEITSAVSEAFNAASERRNDASARPDLAGEAVNGANATANLPDDTRLNAPCHSVCGIAKPVFVYASLIALYAASHFVGCTCAARR